MPCRKKTAGAAAVQQVDSRCGYRVARRQQVRLLYIKRTAGAAAVSQEDSRCGCRAARS